MKKYALAALLALPLLGFMAETVSAQNYCCGGPRPFSTERKYFVVKPAAIYDRQDRDFNTYAKLRAENYVFAKCHGNGWCQIEPRLYENAWVLEDNLEPAGERGDYRSEYRSEYRPERRPEFRPEGRPEGRSGFRSEYSPRPRFEKDPGEYKSWQEGWVAPDRLPRK